MHTSGYDGVQLAAGGSGLVVVGGGGGRTGRAVVTVVVVAVDVDVELHADHVPSRLEDAWRSAASYWLNLANGLLL